MSDHCPQEIFDYIIDFVQHEPETLKRCGLVSKSWIPRTRHYLFSIVKFRTTQDIDKWKKTFLGSPSAPVDHVQTLVINCPDAITEADAAEGGWIPSFTRVSCLRLDNYVPRVVRYQLTFGEGFGSSLSAFRMYAPTLTTLCVSSPTFPRQQVFNLILSLPLLKDLTLIGKAIVNNKDGSNEPLPVALSVSPALTGTLELCALEGMADTTRRLLDIPGGLHFRELKLTWGNADNLPFLTQLVEACSDTLEYIDISYNLNGQAIRRPIDLSKATKLKEIVFRCEILTSGWVVLTLKSLTHEHRDLRQITLHIPFAHHYAMNWRERVVEELTPELRWSDLDTLLVELWKGRDITSQAISPRPPSEGSKGMAEELLPEAAKLGKVEPYEGLNTVLRLGPKVALNKIKRALSNLNALDY